MMLRWSFSFGKPLLGFMNRSASQQSKKTKTSPKKSEKRQKGRVTDDDPCPIHPGSGHTWGDCRANRYSKATTKSCRNSGKTKDKADKSADNFVADVISRDHANSSGEESE
ncbi:hypothetical protein IV203_007336 [Nitzschia inconspicua]|uniref:Uncharacterized protein n=1 Tax=Nitzschia inconspicua TaxID=303405 RepID=A0A9K3KEH2_9STRA|nr:hypothetical protein IV203_007336 [Nitzschia inconspicua]